MAEHSRPRRKERRDAANEVGQRTALRGSEVRDLPGPPHRARDEARRIERTVIGARMRMDFSPVRTQRLSFRNARNPATNVASGFWRAMSIWLPNE